MRMNEHDYAAYLARQLHRLDTLEDEGLARQEQEHSRESEAGFMAQVVSLAKTQGFLVYHTHRSDRSEAGFPDLVLTDGQQTLFVELKTNTGKLTMPQQRWLSLLANAGQEVHVWRPSMWVEITGRLTRRQSLDE